MEREVILFPLNHIFLKKDVNELCSFACTRGESISFLLEASMVYLSSFWLTDWFYVPEPGIFTFLTLTSCSHLPVAESFDLTGVPHPQPMSPLPL